MTALALTALTGVANVLVGGTVLTLGLVGALPNSPHLSGPTVLTVAWTYLVLGCVIVLAAFGLSWRRHSSRVLLTVVMTVAMAVASVSFDLIGTWCSGGSLIGIAMSWVVITLLWNSRANEFFHTAT